MSNQLKQKVLSAFRDIHRARFQVFKGDQNALAITRVEINRRYRENINVKEEDKINELIALSHDCALVLRKQVIQVEEVENEGNVIHRVNITKDTHLIDNTEFQNNISKKDLMTAKFAGKVSRDFNK